jgi:hypothetical protein
LLQICSLLPTNGWTSAASPDMDNRKMPPAHSKNHPPGT